MQILRHLESQLKYIVRDRTSISQRTSYNKGYLAGAAFYPLVKYHRPFVCHFSFNHKGISDCKCCNCWSIFVFFLQFLLLSRLLFFLFLFFLLFFSLSYLFLLEGKALQLCSNHNLGHLSAGSVSCLILEKEPSQPRYQDCWKGGKIKRQRKRERK